MTAITDELTGADEGIYKLTSVDTTKGDISQADASVRHIGEKVWTTSGASSTTAQVMLSASVQDRTWAGRRDR